jgi:hypothetical protein
MSFTIDGKTYKGIELSALIGYHGMYPTDFESVDILSNGQDVAGAELSTFLDLYKEAQASGAMADPAVADTVTSASTQIASLSEVVEDSVAKFGWGWVSNPADITAMQASNVSHMKSDKICESGHFIKGGTICKL